MLVKGLKGPPRLALLGRQLCTKMVRRIPSEPLAAQTRVTAGLAAGRTASMQARVPEQVELAGPANEQNVPGGVNDPQLQGVGASVQVGQAEARRSLRRPGGGAVKQQLNPVVGTQGRGNPRLHRQLPAIGAHRFALAGKEDAGADVGKCVLGVCSPNCGRRQPGCSAEGQKAGEERRRGERPAAHRRRRPKAIELPRRSYGKGKGPKQLAGKGGAFHVGPQKSPRMAAFWGLVWGAVCRKTPLSSRFSPKKPWRRPEAALAWADLLDGPPRWTS